MFLSQPHVSSLAAVFVALSALAGCNFETPNEVDEVAVDQAELESAKQPGIHVTTTYRLVYDGTPTYGSVPTLPLLTIHVMVEDTVLRATRPGFDGLEKPFALVPRKHEGVIRWERVELPSRGPTFRGYYAERRLDVFDVENMRISMNDLEAVREHGIAIGLETNRGTVWAQDSGKNFRVSLSE